MRLLVNGRERTVPEDATVDWLIGELGLPVDGRGVAVAVEGEVVRRSEWPGTSLAPGARVEVLTAVQGG